MIIRKLTILVMVTTFASGFLMTAGIPQAYGQGLQPGVEDSVSESNAAAENVTSKRTSLSDSFSGGMIASVGKVTQLDSTIFALPVLLANIGIPGWIIDFVLGPIYVAVAFDIASLVRGVKIR